MISCVVQFVWSLSLSLILLLSLQQPQNVYGQYFDAFDHLTNHKQKCKLYSCDKGYEPVPAKKMIFQSAGCNAMGGGANAYNTFDMFGGGDEDENNGEKPYEDCCHEYFACTQICGISKQTCDDAYEQCSETKCNDKTKVKDKESCMEQANMNMMMSNMSGCRTFESTQNKACSCVTKYGNRHMKQREESLHQFYKKYAPESIRKVSDLAKKADTMTKMAKLLQKLIHKYPQAIEIVEDPQSRMYRQMFANSGFGNMGADYANAFGGGAGGGGAYGAGGGAYGAGGGGGANDNFDDVDDFDVDEDLGAYGEEDDEDEDEDEEEEEVPPPPPPKKEKNKPPPKKEKKKPPPPPPPVEEEEEEEEPYDEFDQYQEL